MREITVRMPYPGSVISVNHYLGRNKAGGTYVKADASSWKQMLGWSIKQHHIEEWKLPLSVTCDGYFRDENSAPDLSNLSKCTLDAIEETTGINDKDMRWHDGVREIDLEFRPELRITIMEGE